MLRNNHGWGLKEMLFLSALLLFFVLLVAFSISQFYQDLEGGISSSSNSYEAIESRLKVAAKKYHQEGKNEESLILSDTLLSEGYLSLNDLTYQDDICEGYVIVKEKEYTPFIHCAYYESEGY